MVDSLKKKARKLQDFPAVYSYTTGTLNSLFHIHVAVVNFSTDCRSNSYSPGRGQPLLVSKAQQVRRGDQGIDRLRFGHLKR